MVGAVSLPLVKKKSEDFDNKIFRFFLLQFKFFMRMLLMKRG